MDNKNKRGMKKKQDVRIPYETCMKMTVREIRRSREYKLLTPLGKLNKSGAYHYGKKSTMRKSELCRAKKISYGNT